MAQLNIRLLLAVAVIIVAVQVAGWLMARIRQPRVIGEIIAGILLGPSLLGLVAPGVATYLFPAEVIGGLQVLSQFGLVLFMFLVGLHLDTSQLRGNGRTVAAVAPASLLVPLALAVGLGAVIYGEFGADVDPLGFCIFLGAAMAVTAMPVLARILVDLGLDTQRTGIISLACAAINDLVAWCLVAVVVAVIGSSEPLGTLTTVGFALAFVAVLLFVVRPLLGRLARLPVWGVIVVTVLSAWTAEQIGIHAIIGAFLAGLIMPRHPAWRLEVEHRLDAVVRNLLLPIFFAVAGIATRIDQLTMAAVVLLGAVIVIAVVGKIGAATVAARLVGERWSDAATLGVLMNTRGVTELVILALGLELHIIDSTVYTVMVLMALVTTLMAAPLLGLLRVRAARWREPAPRCQ
ncbi:cation:proton antiporter [Pseudonocardia sp. GCM10023141]|uniref:cation:proton antiporter n=1 Tax=Pseudonocardia sp. GCM10023141 TaxID=3252653 RepID=UPI0036213234